MKCHIMQHMYTKVISKRGQSVQTGHVHVHEIHEMHKYKDHAICGHEMQIFYVSTQQNHHLLSPLKLTAEQFENVTASIKQYKT